MSYPRNNNIKYFFFKIQNKYSNINRLYIIIYIENYKKLGGMSPQLIM